MKKVENSAVAVIFHAKNPNCCRSILRNVTASAAFPIFVLFPKGKDKGVCNGETGIAGSVTADQAAGCTAEIAVA